MRLHFEGPFFLEILRRAPYGLLVNSRGILGDIAGTPRGTFGESIVAVIS